MGEAAEATSTTTASQCKNSPLDCKWASQCKKHDHCAWTLGYPCPGQPWTTHSKKNAADDGTLGYICCCTAGMWKMALNDCWISCGRKGGYCSACNSSNGESGACCRLGWEEDPLECNTHGTFSEAFTVAELCRQHCPATPPPFVHFFVHSNSKTLKPMLPTRQVGPTRQV